MAIQLPFGDIVESTAGLSVEDQESLIEILHNRLRESRRAALAKDAREAEAEFSAGKCKPASVDKLMREITA